ncbi:hypothetical protein [Jannaschia sp. W003]|uniref:hypothetical protein n=1 Tax=Jannaschia sp. W003 TaxID=2867012 RepID=UPI0021A7E6C4|nr:hypothetical protein [Jannaschia sp. W003]UWQ20063.1 hypothetical protein K3554_08560 [Jannaschia sp. W003]
MRARVLRSLESADGTRCVDLVAAEGGVAWVECRRDPEDGHGWRRIGVPSGAFADEDAARRDAAATTGWLEADG